ncbi:MAG: hypothetical protein J6B59_04440 [Alistipes sp.]|nr:hypothetical protein [Alistipes sp.]
MKRILFPSLILLFSVACWGTNPTTQESFIEKEQIAKSDEQEHILQEGQPQSLTLEPLPPIDSLLLQKIATGDAILIRYTKPIRGYEVRGWAVPNNFLEGYVDVVLHFKGNGYDFMVSGGCTYLIASDQKQEKRTYMERYEQGVLSAPNDLFFFADIDFDGVEELITDVSPFGGSQRDLPAYTEIYTFNTGKPMRATALFRAKNRIFEAIEPYMFMVTPKRKEIYCYAEGGAMSGGWEVYKYENGNYWKDRYVHWEEVFPSDSIAVEIRSPYGSVRRSFTTHKNTFDSEKWSY